MVKMLKKILKIFKKWPKFWKMVYEKRCILKKWPKFWKIVYFKKMPKILKKMLWNFSFENFPLIKFSRTLSYLQQQVRVLGVAGFYRVSNDEHRVIGQILFGRVRVSVVRVVQLLESETCQFFFGTVFVIRVQDEVLCAGIDGCKISKLSKFLQFFSFLPTKYSIAFVKIIYKLPFFYIPNFSITVDSLYNDILSNDTTLITTSTCGPGSA